MSNGSLNNNDEASKFFTKKRNHSLSTKIPKALKPAPASKNKEYLKNVTSSRSKSRSKSGTKDYIINEKLKKM